MFAGLAWLSWLPETSIKQIQVVGNRTVPEEDVRAYIESRLQGGYLSVFSRANVFLFQPSVVEKELMDAFKKIEEANVSRDGLRSVRVDINERKPYYLWCGARSLVSTQDGCYFLDIDGYAFAPAPYFSGHVYFEFQKQFNAGSMDPIGTHFLPTEEFKRLIGFRNALRALDIYPDTLAIDENGDYIFVLAGNTRIIFNPAQDFDLLFNNLLATFDTEQFKGKKIENTSLEYIDLRFKNKVYYRFK